MENYRHKTIGIVGGMGPQAGIALCESILLHTKATKDQQHLSTIMMSFPGRIGDRSEYLAGTIDQNPAYSISEVILKLEKSGADLIGIACNTAHADGIFNVVQQQLEQHKCKARLLHMPFETARYIRENFKHIQKVGILSSNGTYKLKIYQHILENCGFEAIAPDWTFQQEIIHRLIYDPRFGIKANPQGITDKAKELWKQALNYMKAQNTEAIILGCTELSLIVTEKDKQDILIIDSTESLAKALIKEAINQPVLL